MEMSARLSNWATVAGCLAMILGTAWVGGRELQAMENAIAENSDKNEAQDKILLAIQEQQKLLNKILVQQASQVENVYKRGLIVQGKALVLDVGDEPYIELNNWDPNGPNRLKGFKKIRITNLTHPDMIMTEVDIGPSMSNTTPGYVMNLSKGAGEILHARPGQWIEIRAIPVFEEK